MRSMLLINFCVACLYLVICYGHIKDGACLRTRVIRFSIMCICPVVGFCFFLGSYLIDKLFSRIQPSLNDVIFEKNKVKTQLRADESLAKNTVSLEESLFINGSCDFRNVMMTTIKGAKADTISVIAQGLDSDDPEVIHYVASYVMDETDRFRIKVLDLYSNIKSGQNAVELLKYMYDRLDPSLFIGSEYRKFVLIMWDALCFMFDRAIDDIPTVFDECQYVFGCLLKINELFCAEKCLVLLKSYFSDTSVYHNCCLQFYYATGNRSLFFDMLSDLRTSNVYIDESMLEVIRFFDARCCA